MAVGGNGVGLAAVVQFEADVVPDDAGGNVSRRNGKRHLILAWLQQSGVELLNVLVPDSLVGVVAQGVGGDGMDGADGLAVDGDGEAALRI